MKWIHKITFLLLVVGGLNWGVFALFGWDIGQLFGGMGTITSKAIYVLVGLSAVYEAVRHIGMCKECKGK